MASGPLDAPDAMAPPSGHTLPQQQGGAVSAPGTIEPVSEQESARVKAWLSRIAVTRKHDRHRHTQYAIDRKYARGDSSFDVSVPVLPTFLDLLLGFVYARNPEVEAPPAERMNADGTDDAETNRLFGKTVQLVIMQLWRKNGIKRKGKRLVLSGLTCGIGWIKVTWQEKLESDPTIVDRARDLQDNINRLYALQTGVADGSTDDAQRDEAEIRDIITGMSDKAERKLYNGLGLAFVRPEDMVISLDAETVVDNTTAAFNAERWFMPLDDAISKFSDKIPRQELEACANWSPREEPDREKRRASGEEASFGGGMSESDADSYKQGAAEGAKFICGYEVWDQTTNTFFDLIVGCNRYATAPAAPNAACTRFYPYFAWAPIEIDGERHPPSLIERSITLADEYDRLRTAHKTHRSRIKPKLVFDATSLSVASVKKLEGGVTAEMVGIKLIGGKTAKAAPNLGQILQPVNYNPIDPGLYDTSTVKSDLELVWGIQEALTGVTVQKTATESEIQANGTQSRNGSKRDSLEDMFTEIAQTTAEYAMQKLSDEEVRTLAGPGAMWIHCENVDELEQLISLRIKAGSTGKPNTAARQQAWAQLMPVLQQAIEQIATLTQSSPMEKARALEELVKETIDRTDSGDVDPQRFLPAPGEPQVLMTQDGMPVIAYVDAEATAAVTQQMGMAGGAPGMPGTPPPSLAAPGVPADISDRTSPTQRPEGL